MHQPICDLIVLSWNHLEETQRCLQSLFEATRTPSRLLIVDNGSEPYVRKFLAAVKPGGAIQDVVLLQNETNEGFSRGMNRGIRASTAPFVCLLNNDLVFAEGWLEELIRVAQEHPSIGVVNPASSTFGLYPPTGLSLAQFAASRQPLQGQYTEMGMCIGFCMLVKRTVLDQVAGLDEETGRAFFEDEDFCMRAQQVGFQCVLAAGSYVYHAEHRSVREIPERKALFARNRVWCEGKWGRRIRIAWPRLEPLVPGSAGLKALLERFLCWARRRSHVYVYCPMPAGMNEEALFRSVGLVPHADVHWYRVSAPLAALKASVLMFSRTKKRFDIVAAPSRAWEQWMRRLQWWHRAEVVMADNEEQLLEVWKRRSRSPS